MELDFCQSQAYIMYYQFIITYKFLHKKSNIAEKYSFKNRNSEEKTL